MGIFSLVLAAGAADRFGSPKQLAEYAGQSLVQRAVKLASHATGPRTVLVVGAHWQRVVDDCRTLAPFMVLNEQYRNGMGSSLACGIRAVRPLADAALVLLGDQPLISAGHLLALQEQWLASRDSVVATEYSGIAGPPAIFPAACFPAMLELRGDRGARSIIEGRGKGVIRMPFADGAVDIDTPEDLREL